MGIVRLDSVRSECKALRLRLISVSLKISYLSVSLSPFSVLDEGIAVVVEVAIKLSVSLSLEILTVKVIIFQINYSYLGLIVSRRRRLLLPNDSWPDEHLTGSHLSWQKRTWTSKFTIPVDGKRNALNVADSVLEPRASNFNAGNMTESVGQPELSIRKRDSPLADRA